MTNEPGWPSPASDARIGIATCMIVAQISDLHIVEPNRMTCGVAPMAENLARCIEALNALTPRPDLAMISGDVTHNGAVGQAEHAARLLDELACPYWLVPGNHDNREVLHRVFAGKACDAQLDRFLCYTLEDHDLRIIALDSLDEGAPGGRLCETRLAWLRARLDEYRDRPTVLVLHHPPLRLGLPETDIDGFHGAEEFGRIVAEHPNILRILCGHIHLPTHSAWQGSIVSTAPSIGMDLALDLNGAHLSRFVLSEPAYLLHRLTPEGVLVSHVRRLPEPAALFDFS